MRVGIDIGGVIIDRSNDKTDTSFFSNNYLNTTAVPAAFEGIARLVHLFGWQNTYIVSKAGEKTTARSREWLAHHDFFVKTGFHADHLNFCAERIDKDPICRKLEITHFIDDKIEVLSYLKTVPHLYAFQPTRYEREFYQGDDIMNHIIISQTWPDIVSAITWTFQSR